MLWVAYFAIHSILASGRVKKALGEPSWYRLFYVFISIATLVPVFIYGLGIESKYLFQISVATKIPSVGLGYAAYFIFRKAAKSYNLKAFIGVAKETRSELKTDGILSKMRHPFYTATIAIVLGFFLWSPTVSNLVLVLTWIAYLPIGIWLEEKKLIDLFGDAYLDYKKQVPALFPRSFK